MTSSTATDWNLARNGKSRIRANATFPPAQTSRPQHSVPTVIVEQGELFRLGLTQMLAGSKFRVTATRPGVSDLPKRAFGEKGCVALIGLDRNGKNTLSQIASLTGQGFRVIVLAEKFEPAEFIESIEAGASGYLIKDTLSLNLLLSSLELALAEGGLVIPRHALRSAVTLPEANAAPVLFAADASVGSQEPAEETARSNSGRQFLSPREQSILESLTRGLSNKHIGRELGISEATVKVHVKSLLRKIDVRNRTQAAMWALKHLTRPAIERPPADAHNSSDRSIPEADAEVRIPDFRRDLAAAS